MEKTPNYFGLPKYIKVMVGAAVAITALLLVLSFTLAFQLLHKEKPHTCIDQSHEICDGHCECDGLGCATATKLVGYQIIPLRDYQIDIVEDSFLIFDGKRFVGRLPVDSDKDNLTKLINEDNE